MTPGLYDIPEAEYHADPCQAPSLSSSVAKILLTQSPLHAWTAHPRLNPYYEPEEKTAFDLGSAAHALLLEGEDRMTKIDAKDYKTKDAQAARDEARAAGKHPVLKARYPDVQKMRNAALLAITACTNLSGYTLAAGLPERALIWQEDEIWCRCKPDSLANDRTLILDYKSTTDASPPAFNRQIESGLQRHHPGRVLRQGSESAIRHRAEIPVSRPGDHRAVLVLIPRMRAVAHGHRRARSRACNPDMARVHRGGQVAGIPAANQLG